MTSEDGETPVTAPEATPDAPLGRIFLVVIDDTEELKPALEYACLRAKRSGGRVALLYVIAPIEFEHFMFVGDVMREDRRKEAEALVHRITSYNVCYTKLLRPWRTTGPSGSFEITSGSTSALEGSGSLERRP